MQRGGRLLLGWRVSMICPRLEANLAAEVGWDTLPPDLSPRARRLSTYHTSGRSDGLSPPLCLRWGRGLRRASQKATRMSHEPPYQAVVCLGAHSVRNAPPLDSHLRGSATGRWGDANIPRCCAAGKDGSDWLPPQQMTTRRARRRVENMVPDQLAVPNGLRSDGGRVA